MITIEKVDVMGWEQAVRSMRNPMNSWDKMDSKFVRYASDERFEEPVTIGEADHKLMMQLANGGAVHAKYRRMIPVFLTINAPLYWWKEFDTYKVGTVANSCSTMHKIHSKEFTLDDFSHDHLIGQAYPIIGDLISALNDARDSYLKFDEYFNNNELDKEITCKKDVWWQMIQLLPTSYNQKRTVMLNYEVLVNIYHSRKNHRLDEWHTFCDWIEQLPYSELITGGDADV